MHHHLKAIGQAVGLEFGDVLVVVGGRKPRGLRRASEVANHQHTIQLGYDLVASEDPELKAIRQNLIVELWFSINPDGQSIVAIVNETFARAMFGNTSALGRRFLWGEKRPYEIVGVVENGKYDSLTETPQAAMFFPLDENPDSDTSLVVRSPLPEAEIAPEVHRRLAQIDASLPFVFHGWPDALALVLFPARVATATLGVMGLLAAMLALTGVFGMAMYSVSKRMKEFGIRVALGALAAQLLRSALGRPLLLLFSGSAAGLLLGVLASQLLAQIVYQATPRDPLVLAGVVITMALLGFLATWIPAERALRVHPARLLREE